MKSNYFYIDETGHVNNDSSIFVFGCIKTDTPILIKNALDNTIDELASDRLLSEFGQRLIENNFHATSDPFDIRTIMYRMIPYMSFRSYFYVLLKQGEFFEDLKANKEDHEIIEILLRKLIVPKLNKHRDEMNYFYFETLEVEKKSLTKILSDIFKDYEHLRNFEYFIVGKECSNMPVIDYMNFALNKLLTCKVNEKLEDWVIRVFEAIKDKIGLVHILNDDSFYSNRGKNGIEITIENLKSRMAVVRDKL